jgi:hypothetical protein
VLLDTMRSRRRWLVIAEGREPEYEDFKELIGFREDKTGHRMRFEAAPILKGSDETSQFALSPPGPVRGCGSSRIGQSNRQQPVQRQHGLFTVYADRERIKLLESNGFLHGLLC